MTDFIVAESAIRQLHARYTDAVWRKDYDAFGDCFTEDAEWRISGMVLRGRVEIVNTIKQLLPKFRRVIFTLRTPILEVGDRGRNRQDVSLRAKRVRGWPALWPARALL